MTFNAQTRLADHPGEHNARRKAFVAHARVKGDWADRIDAAFIPTLTDGFGDFSLDYPAKAEVSAIHRSLALAYSVQNKVTMSVAYDATGWEAFLVYDAGCLAVAA